jgi:phthalate 4,5-dioxygenase oxygenase subunit
MLSREENELLTRVGRGTPMGEMIRRFWVPACLSEELPEPDGDPIRVRLLGEDLIAFRDTNGRPGVMQERCPHRGASLYFGRNEGGGIRCLYHGWKVDVTGKILDTPCEPAESMIRHHVTHAAYPVVERGDVVWAYLGPKTKQPPFPNYWWTNVPASQRVVGKIDYACNYLQTVEGTVSDGHNSALHAGFALMHWTPEQMDELKGVRQVGQAGDGVALPHTLDVVDTPYGFRYGNFRYDRSGQRVANMTPMLLPFHVWLHEVPHMFVPADDEHTWLYDVRASERKPVDHERELTERGERVGPDLAPDHHKLRTLANNYQQDRQAMRERRAYWSYSGIPWGKPLQDMLVTESMLPIYDRETEHLGMSDCVVVHLRQRMLAAVRRFMETGETPAEDSSIKWDRIRGGTSVVPEGTPWAEVEYPDEASVGLR